MTEPLMVQREVQVAAPPATVVPKRPVRERAPWHLSTPDTFPARILHGDRNGYSGDRRLKSKFGNTRNSFGAQGA